MHHCYLRTWLKSWDQDLRSAHPKSPAATEEFSTEQITDSLVVKESTLLNIKAISANILIKYSHDFEF